MRIFPHRRHRFDTRVLSRHRWAESSLEGWPHARKLSCWAAKARRYRPPRRRSRVRDELKLWVGVEKPLLQRGHWVGGWVGGWLEAVLHARLLGLGGWLTTGDLRQRVRGQRVLRRQKGRQKILLHRGKRVLGLQRHAQLFHTLHCDKLIQLLLLLLLLAHLEWLALAGLALFSFLGFIPPLFSLPHAQSRITRHTHQKG